MPVWHASVAKHDPSGLVEVEAWRPKDWMRARELLAEVLDGVGRPGEPFEVEEKTAFSLQWRRLSSDEERSVIGPAKDVRRKP